MAIPEWLWIFLGISFVTTILFAVIRAKSLSDKEERLRRYYDR